MTPRRWLLVSAVLAGCVFRNAAGPRYFEPDSAAMRDAADGIVPSPSRKAVPVRLAAVHGMPFLRERVVWRRSAVEYGRYEQRRWSDLPASYVERALAAELRRTPAVRLSDEPHAAVLGVEVVAFEEVFAPAHAATVGLLVSLRDGDRRRLLDRTFTATEPIAGNDPADMAAAMGRALDAAAGATAAAVAAAVHG